MLMIDLAGTDIDAEERELLRHPLVGGVVLFTRNYRNPRQLEALCDAARDAAGELLLIAADHEGGRVQRFRDGFTELPPAAELGRQWQADKAAACEAARVHGRVTARDLLNRGVDLPFAPVADLDRGGGTVIGDRAFSGDPVAVGALALAFVEGLREGGVVATAKHFPGHGGVAEDSHETLPVDTRARDELESADMLPFRALIAAGVESVMMAHVRYETVDARPASMSPVWIRGILREELGFAGAVFCDDISMAGAAVCGGHADRALAALEAGCDMVPVCHARAGVIEILDTLTGSPSRDSMRRLAALKPLRLPA